MTTQNGKIVIIFRSLSAYDVFPYDESYIETLSSFPHINNVIFRDIENLNNMISVFNTLNIQDDTIEHFVIQAHGSSISIQLGSDELFLKSYNWFRFLDFFTTKVERKLTKNASIFLHSCQSAQGIKSLSYELSGALPKHIIYGATDVVRQMDLIMKQTSKTLVSYQVIEEKASPFYRILSFLNQQIITQEQEEEYKYTNEQQLIERQRIKPQKTERKRIKQQKLIEQLIAQQKIQQQHKTERKRIKQQKTDRKRIEQQQKAEKQRIEQQKTERQRIEQQQKTERQRIEQQQKAETQRIEQQKTERQRIEQQQKAETQRIEQQKTERQRIEQQQKAETQRIEQQKTERQRIEQQQKAETQRIEQQKVETQRIEQQKTERQRIEQQKTDRQIKRRKLKHTKVEGKVIKKTNTKKRELLSRCQCYKALYNTIEQCPNPAKEQSLYCGKHHNCDVLKVKFVAKPFFE